VLVVAGLAQTTAALRIVGVKSLLDKRFSADRVVVGIC
jgi:hypothetical protein